MMFAEVLKNAENAAGLYISIGGNIHDVSKEERIRTQQFPVAFAKMAANDPNGTYKIILNAANWENTFPLITQLIHGRIDETPYRSFIPIEFPNVEIMIVQDFFNRACETELCTFIKQHKNIYYLLGDFTITCPWEPFNEFPTLRELRDTNIQVDYIDKK